MGPNQICLNIVSNRFFEYFLEILLLVGPACAIPGDEVRETGARALVPRSDKGPWALTVTFTLSLTHPDNAHCMQLPFSWEATLLVDILRGILLEGRRFIEGRTPSVRWPELQQEWFSQELLEQGQEFWQCHLSAAARGREAHSGVP